MPNPSAMDKAGFYVILPLPAKTPGHAAKKGSENMNAGDKDPFFLEVRDFYWNYLQEYAKREDASIGYINEGIRLLKTIDFSYRNLHSDKSLGPSTIPSRLSHGAYPVV